MILRQCLLLSCLVFSSLLLAAPEKPAVPNLTNSLVTVVISLFIVVGVIVVCMWVLKRLGGNHFTNDQGIQVISQKLIGQKERLMIIRVADKTLLLGVTPGSIHKLDELPEDFLPEKEMSKVTFQQAFTEQLSKMMGKNRDA